MQYYKKLKSGNTTIEFHNSWTGEETVIANGQVVSKKSSVWGTNHYFTVMEDSHHIRYILTTRINESLQVVLDLSRNGKLLYEGVPAQFGWKSGRPRNNAKREGLSKLQEYDLELALMDFERALEIDPEDPEIYFHMACAYSVLERTQEGFEAIKNSVACGLQDQEEILKHDMLAYLRMHEAFEGFLDSGFTEYDGGVVE